MLFLEILHPLCLKIKMNKLEKVLDNLKEDFVFFGIKKEVNAVTFSEFRKLAKFYVRKKTLVQKAFKEKNIDFNISEITKKEQQTICIISNNVMQKIGKLLENKKYKNKIDLHLVSISNECFKEKKILDNFRSTSVSISKTREKDKFILQNINNIFSSSMRNFLLLLKKISENH